MNIDITEYIDLKDMRAEGRVIVTNGIDVEISLATLRYGEDGDWKSHFDKTLPNGEITHWKHI